MAEGGAVGRGGAADVVGGGGCGAASLLSLSLPRDRDLDLDLDPRVYIIKNAWGGGDLEFGTCLAQPPGLAAWEKNKMCEKIAS